MSEICESFDTTPCRWRWTERGLNTIARFSIGEMSYDVVLFNCHEDEYDLSFSGFKTVDGDFDSTQYATGTGNANKVYATVIAIVRCFMKKTPTINLIRIESDTTERNRHRVNLHLAKKIAANYGFEVKSDEAHGQIVVVRPGYHDAEAAVSPLEEATAWHGSKHLFDVFKISEIGKGYGNQAHGWGIYFADRKENADFYKKMLSNINYKKKPLKRFPATTQEAIMAIHEFGWSKEDAKERYPKLSEIIDGINERDVVSSGGKTYEVEIPGDENFLMYDVSFKEQSPKVKKCLRALAPAYGTHLKQVIRDNDPGRVIYAHMSNFNRNVRRLSPNEYKQTSLDLFSAGIAGLKYFDGDSHEVPAAGSPYNYVVFDESLVKIVKTHD